MKPYQVILLVLFTAALSGAFGWTARGDKIYSSMFIQQAVGLGELK